MTRLIVISYFFVLAKGFMFDQLSEKLRCQGLALMCPPMCLHQNPNGCSTCDCSNIDPSHPKAPGTSGGNSVDPSRHLSASAGCDDWTKCACVPIFDVSSGCLKCPCGNSAITRPLYQPTVTPTSAFKSTETVTTPPNQSTKQVTSSVTSASSSLSPVTMTPSDITSSTTSQITSTPFATKTSPGVTTSVTSQKLDTNLPNIATIPLVNTALTTLTTTTLAPIVCPGIFSCTLDCYTGFDMDKNGCPLCQCAPTPTDLP
ncbi:mucin-2-like [Ruditapes philippinarum]|uniref:mucin-2-like n=1 Tax=Ruditapes philippinarum TaxID=129788 RepID=UPI00295B997E|nr:mucin-2-like [Ruditapes philippinarum]